MSDTPPSSVSSSLNVINENNLATIIKCITCGLEGDKKTFKGKFCSKACIAKNAQKQSVANKLYRRAHSITLTKPKKVKLNNKLSKKFHHLPTNNQTSNNIIKLNEEQIQESIYQTSHKSSFDLPIYVNYNKKILPQLEEYTNRINDIKKWSSKDVSKFVLKLTKCTISSDVFINENIDGEAFLLLKQSDLIEILKLKLGPSLKIFNSILTFRELL